MVCLLMPAALATSDSVIDDQSRVSSRSRIPSRIESRSSTLDASAYGMRCAVRPSFTAATIARQERATSTISKSDLAAPQSGQLQSSGMSSHRVPGAMPSSGQPFSSSYSKPHCTQTNSL